MNKHTRLTIATIVSLVLLGGAAAWHGELSLVPLSIMLAGMMTLYVGVQYVGHRELSRGEARPRLRLLILGLCTLVSGIAVWQTSGADSPLNGLLFLPILLAALSFGFVGSTLAGVVVSIIFFLFHVLGRPERPVAATEVDPALLQIIVFGVVALVSGAFAEGLHRTADEAAARAIAETERAAHLETKAAESAAVLDTSIMMGAMTGLEDTLSIATLRLSDLVPGDVAAILLREPDSPNLSLELLTGVAPNLAEMRNLPLEEIELRWRNEIGVESVRGVLWKDITDDDRKDMGVLARIDPAARSVIVAPLRTLDDFLGLIYVNSHRDGVLTERHRDLVSEFAKHVVLPIQRQRLMSMATTDAMTGLSNYRAFRLRLEDEARRAHRYQHALSLVLLDIDHFKRVNDTYGHPAGDAVLGQLSAILRRTLRSIDVAARYGGEEMAIILPETDAVDAVIIADRIRHATETNRFVLPGGADINITVSLGVATLPIHATGDVALIEATDKALYVAKTSGRNRVCLAESTEAHAA